MGFGLHVGTKKKPTNSIFREFVGGGCFFFTSSRFFFVEKNGGLETSKNLSRGCRVLAVPCPCQIWGDPNPKS